MNYRILIGFVLLALFVGIYHFAAAVYARQAKETLQRRQRDNKYEAMLSRFRKIGSYEFWLTGSEIYQQLSESVHQQAVADEQQEDKK